MPMDQIIAKLFAHSDELDRQRECQLAPLVVGIVQARHDKQTVVVGRLLLKAKGIVPYREWVSWLEEIDLPYHYAVQAMRVAKADRAVAQRWQLKDAAE
jgi:hypothetical protein